MDQELLSKVVSDFDVLYRAYECADLLAEDSHTETEKKLLGSGDDVYRFKREFLLAEALIRNRVGRLVHGDNGLRHQAVFGGDNVGKSTVINILAAGTVASTSPEGGHTRHAQACFAPSVQGGVRQFFGDNPHAFRRFTPVAAGALDRNRFDQYGESRFISDVVPPDVVLWDMPDCDATESRRYMHAVVEAVSSAEALVYVTSVERYAVSHSDRHLDPGGHMVANLSFPPLRNRFRKELARRAEAAFDAVWQRTEFVLQDHVESVGRLAQQGRELLQTVDNIRQFLAGSAEDDREVQRLFGEEASPAVVSSLPTEAPALMPKRRRLPKEVLPQ